MIPNSVQIETKNPKIRFQVESILGSMDGFRILNPDDNINPDLLFCEIGTDAETEFQAIETLLGSGQVGEVFLTAADTSPDLILRAMRAGAKEFLPQPIRPEEVKQALLKFRERRQVRAGDKSPRRGRVVHVIGSKGGIGTTTVAVNLAASLSRNGKEHSVCLIDLNMPFGEIPLFLDLAPAYTWGEILKNMDRLDPTYLMNITAKHSSGVHLLTAPTSLNGTRPHAAESVARLLDFMRKQYDFIIVDSGQTVNDIMIKVFKAADAALLISILTFPCLANMNKLLQSLRNYEINPNERIRIIINRYLKKSEITLGDAEKSLSANIFWTIPNDYPAAVSAINQGKPLIQTAPRAPMTRSLEELAGRLFPEEGKQEKKRWSLFGR